MKYLTSNNVNKLAAVVAATISISILGCFETVQPKQTNSNSHQSVAQCELKTPVKEGNEAFKTFMEKLSHEFEPIQPKPDITDHVVENVDSFEDTPKIPFKVELKTNDLQYSKAYFADALQQKGFEDDYISKFNKIPRVNTFAFFGRKSSPNLIKKKNGICTKTDEIDIVNYFVDSLQHGGYVSATKSPHIAKWFAASRFGEIRDGYVYVGLIIGGLEDYSSDEKAKYEPVIKENLDFNKRIEVSYDMHKRIYKHPILFSPYNQDEIAVYRGLPWNQFVAYRKVSKSGLYDGPIFFRKGLKEAAPDAYDAIRCYLSGGTQSDCVSH